MNRISKLWDKPETLSNIQRFFLACEFKPNSKLWYTLESVAYDVVPAFTHGKLGILSYDPASYAILSIDDLDEPLMGYLMTITNPDGVFFLDKVKGFNGKNAFNTHYKVLSHVFTEPDKVTNAWTYVISPYVLNVYEQIEQISFGVWDNDAKQKQLLNTIQGDQEEESI